MDGFRNFFAVVPLCLLAACASTPVPQPVARAAPAPTPPAPPVQQDWRDVPLTPGSWAYVADATGSSAMFGRVGAEADFILRCDAATRTIIFSQPGSAAQGITMAFTTLAGNRSYPVAVASAATARIGATTAASDPFLDWLAFSRGRFVVATTGLPQLVLPAWPEPARAIEDCRK